MTHPDLARSYLRSARRRLGVLPMLRDAGGFNDVVREAQEVVELALKAMLRSIGVDPPHVHDVGAILLANAARFPDEIGARLPALAEASRALRRSRELSFYGAADFVPDQQFTPEDAGEAIEAAKDAVAAASTLLEPQAKPS
jgi:HEPN domain-containing protein